MKAQTQVNAPVEALAQFHSDSQALKKLTPLPILVQIHSNQPLSEGSETEFTLWFGPLPIRWLARHSQVNVRTGFIDSQVRGPMHRWVHHHHWQALNSHQSLLQDEIHYEHRSGWRGWLTRLLFAPALLRILLAYRHFVTRQAVTRRSTPPHAPHSP